MARPPGARQAPLSAAADPVPIKRRKRPSRTEAEAAIRTLIEWAGDDPDREGLRGTPGTACYSASKGALERWAESLAQEIAPFGLGVSVLVSGTFATDILTEQTPHYGDPSGPYARHYSSIDRRGRAAVDRLIADNKGFISKAEERRHSGSQRTGTITIKVPVENFQTLVTGLAALGHAERNAIEGERSGQIQMVCAASHSCSRT